MRLYLKLRKSNETVPFDYQHLLTGTLHKWIGKENKEHGEVSMYSFSWLQNTSASQIGINLSHDSYFFISAYDQGLIKLILSGILKEPYLFNGVFVKDVQIVEPPVFESKQKFMLGSPVFIKRRDKGKEMHILFDNEESNSCLTETLKKKLAIAGLATDGVEVRFDSNYINPKTKLVDYKGIRNRVNMCPIIISGSQEQIGFAWNVGVGNSTGIGFGALK